MRVQGVVRSLEGDDAWVDVAVSGGCGRCNEPGGCGGVNIARPFGLRRSLRLRNDIQAQPGDAVGVEVDDEVPLRAAWLTYGWPVLGVVGGAFAGALISASDQVDLPAAFGAVTGGLVAWLAARARGLTDIEPRLRMERAGLSDTGGCGR